MACQSNLVLYGPVGTGKTHLAVALGRLACMRAIRGGVLGDKNMAAALIDRTVRHGRLTGFGGGSYRSEHALMTR